MKKIFLTLALGLAMTHAAAENIKSGPVKVLMETSAGRITLELDADKAPKSVANFVQYVTDKHYDGLSFHRVIKNFMIQGGGYDEKYSQRSVRKAIENEAKNGLTNVRGSIAMARTGEPHSATSQFFINHADNARLNYPSFDGWGYAVFGKVVEGMDVVDKIAESQTGAIPPFGRDVPVTPIIIQRMTIVEAK